MSKKKAASLGLVQSNRLSNMFYDKSQMGTGALEQLSRWSVGPLTQMKGSFDKAPRPAAESVGQAAISTAGAKGVTWLLENDFLPDRQWFTAAINSHRPDIDKVLDAVVAAGLDPNGADSDGNTLWHLAAFGQNFSEPVVKWLQTNKVDWSGADAQGDTPLSLLLGAISYHSGVSSFFEHPIFGNGIRSLGNKVIQEITSLSGKGGLVAEIGKDLKESKTHLKIMEDLAVEMVQSGESLKHANKNGITAAENYTPEQSRLTQVLMRQAPAGSDPNGYLLQKLTDGISGATPRLSFRDPDMYGVQQQAFLRRLEAVSGETLLDAPALVVGKARHRGP